MPRELKMNLEYISRPQNINYSCTAYIIYTPRSISLSFCFSSRSQSITNLPKRSPPTNMAPVSHFALAALAITSVAAAPLLTPPNSAATLQPRGWIQDLLDDMNLFGKHVGEKTEYKTETMLEDALKVEKQLKGEHDKRDASPPGIIPPPPPPM